MSKLETPALHRKYIREGKMTIKESQRLMAEAHKRDSLEEESIEKIVDCERCGETNGVKMIGDETYDSCPDCGWITH